MLSWPLAGANAPMNPAADHADRASARVCPISVGTVSQAGAGVGVGSGVGGGVGCGVGRGVGGGGVALPRVVDFLGGVGGSGVEVGAPDHDAVARGVLGQ